MPLTDWGLLGRQGSPEGPPPRRLRVTHASPYTGAEGAAAEVGAGLRHCDSFPGSCVARQPGELQKQGQTLAGRMAALRTLSQSVSQDPGEVSLHRALLTPLPAPPHLPKGALLQDRTGFWPAGSEPALARALSAPECAPPRQRLEWSGGRKLSHKSHTTWPSSRWLQA